MSRSNLSSTQDRELANAVKRALEQSTQDLDAETLKLLREARVRALEKQKKRFNLWAWPSLVTAMALSAFIILPTMMHHSARDMEQAKILMESNDDDLASVDNLDMLEDMELIQAVSEEVSDETT